MLLKTQFENIISAVENIFIAAVPEIFSFVVQK